MGVDYVSPEQLNIDDLNEYIYHAIKDMIWTHPDVFSNIPKDYSYVVSEELLNDMKASVERKKGMIGIDPKESFDPKK